MRRTTFFPSPPQGRLRAICSAGRAKKNVPQAHKKAIFSSPFCLAPKSGCRELSEQEHLGFRHNGRPAKCSWPVPYIVLQHPRSPRGASEAARELEINLEPFLTLAASQALSAKCLLYSLPGYCFPCPGVFPQHRGEWKITGDEPVPGPHPGRGELRLHIHLGISSPRDAAGAETP